MRDRRGVVDKSGAVTIVQRLPESVRTQWIITPGEDLRVDWDAPPADARTAVVLTLAIDQHGSSPSSLECEFEDTGAGLVPVAVVDALIGAGVFGFPSGSLTRGTVDSVPVEEGCVDFSVVSSQSVEVSVSGYIPCSGPDTCSEGMTCNLETFLCECLVVPCSNPLGRRFGGQQQGAPQARWTATPASVRATRG